MGYVDYLLKHLQINYSLTTVRLITTGVFPNSGALLTYNNLSVPHTLKKLTTWVFLTLQYGFNFKFLGVPNLTLLNCFNIY